MPLPDADPPEMSRLYEELKSKTALPGATGAITADLLDNLKNATFLDADNEDQLRRLVLLMQATGAGSVSGPLAGGQELVEFQVTGSGYNTIFTPGVGEMYQYAGGCINTIVGISGTVTVEMDFANTTSGARLLFIDQATASSSDQPLVESNPGSPLYFGYPQVLRIRGEGTFTEINTTHNIIRVR